MDFRTLLEKKLDELYVEKRSALEDIILSELDYRQTFGYLQAIRQVGAIIKETIQDINGGNGV